MSAPRPNFSGVLQKLLYLCWDSCVAVYQCRANFPDTACVVMLALLSMPALSLLVYLLQLAVVFPLLLQWLCRFVLDRHPLSVIPKAVDFLYEWWTRHSHEAIKPLPESLGFIAMREDTAAWLTDLSHNLDTLQHAWSTEDYQRGTKLHPDAGDVIKHLRVWLRLDENPDVVRRDERLKAVVGEGGKLLDTVQSYFGISASPEIPICLKNAIEGLGQVADDMETLDQIQQPHVDASAPSIQDLKTTLFLVGSFINKANEK